VATYAILRVVVVRLDIDDLIICRSDSAGDGVLSVTVHELPATAPAVTMPKRDAYCFWYRPRVEKGCSRVTSPELGFFNHRVSRGHVAPFPPGLACHAEWERAEGRVARLSFSPRFCEAVAAEVGVPGPGSKQFWHAFFAIDQLVDTLCRLLMEEIESGCPHGQRYFEGLAHALAVGALSAVRDQRQGEGRLPPAVPPGIHRAVQSLETGFARDLSLVELAAQAQLSRGHFAHAFRQLTGYTPHQYLLRVRLSHARKLLAQESEALSFSDIARACGFFDQSHLIRADPSLDGFQPTQTVVFSFCSSVNEYFTGRSLKGHRAVGCFDRPDSFTTL
jgi:AraC family transcriptional regulator